jgi:hypothetical protein
MCFEENKTEMNVKKKDNIYMFYPWDLWILCDMVNGAIRLRNWQEEFILCCLGETLMPSCVSLEGGVGDFWRGMDDVIMGID